MVTADQESGGSYHCRATTELEEELSVEHRVDVRARTHFTLSPQHTTVIQVISGQPLTSHLLCEPRETL